MRTRRVLVLILLAVSLVLVSCGTDDNPDAGTGSASGAFAEPPVSLPGKLENRGTEDVSAKGDATVALELDDNYFKPTFLKAKPGATLTLELKNEGSNQHTFSLDDGQVDRKVDPGKSATVTVTVPDSGAVRFHCNFHGDGGMQGAIYTADGDTVGGSGSGGSGDSGTTTTKAADANTDGY